MKKEMMKAKELVREKGVHNTKESKNTCNGKKIESQAD